MSYLQEEAIKLMGIFDKEELAELVVRVGDARIALEKKYEDLHSIYEKGQEQNKRYREALEAFKNMPLVDDEKVNLIIMGVREVAKEALEG